MESSRITAWCARISLALVIYTTVFLLLKTPDTVPWYLILLGGWIASGLVVVVIIIFTSVLFIITKRWTKREGVDEIKDTLRFKMIMFVIAMGPIFLLLGCSRRLVGYIQDGDGPDPDGWLIGPYRRNT